MNCKGYYFDAKKCSIRHIDFNTPRAYSVVNPHRDEVIKMTIFSKG